MTLRKLSALLLAAALLLGLCACGDFVSIMPGTELETAESDAGGAEDGDTFTVRPLFAFLNMDEFGERYYSDTPVALSYQSITGDTRGCRSYVFDRASIVAACDALCGVTLQGRAEGETESGGEYILTMSDGREYSFTFGSLSDGTRTLRTNTGSYIVSGGEALFSLAFPAYSGDFDLFDLYFSDSIRAFADGFYESRPVSVGLRLSSGATITSEDADTVDAVFRALSGARVTVVENYPDQNIDLTQTRDYIFTMEDGTYYTFSFAQQCLAVRAVSGFQTVYYWLSDISGLFDIEIRSDTSAGSFEGGVVADLRDDIRTAAKVVSGQTETLSISGIFVEFDIDGQSGYITLSGDTAAAFLVQALSVAVSPETVAEPSGDKVTISVTLSDLSGPILYFTGDSIQQVVGMSYACSSDDMNALRSTILELASSGENAGEVAEGTTD